MSTTVAAAVSAFGAAAKAKLGSPAISGSPEDQLRGPLETFMQGMAEAAGLPAGVVQLISVERLKEAEALAPPDETGDK